jgi:hypothetical protein
MKNPILAAILTLILSSLACMEQVATPTPAAMEPTSTPLPATATRRAAPSATATSEADVQTAVVRAAFEPAGYVFQGCLSIAEGRGCVAR